MEFIDVEVLAALAHAQSILSSAHKLLMCDRDTGIPPQCINLNTDTSSGSIQGKVVLCGCWVIEADLKVAVSFFTFCS
jgi:hypothetical protein